MHKIVPVRVQCCHVLPLPQLICLVHDVFLFKFISFLIYINSISSSCKLQFKSTVYSYYKYATFRKKKDAILLTIKQIMKPKLTVATHSPKFTSLICHPYKRGWMRGRRPRQGWLVLTSVLQIAGA